MTCHWIRQNVRHIGIIHLVSISTISPQSTCHSAPVCEILSKSDHRRQKKMTSCRFSRWRISAILDFSSLKSPCTTSYRSSIETIALNCLVFLRKSRFFCILATDRQTNKQTDRQTNRWTACMEQSWQLLQVRYDSCACMEQSATRDSGLLLTFDIPEGDQVSPFFRQSYGWRGVVYSDSQQTSELSCATV